VVIYVVFEKLSEVEQRAMNPQGLGAEVRAVSRGSGIFLLLDWQKWNLQQG